MTPEIGSTVTVHPSGRVKVLPLPLALPGKCVICGASNNDDGRFYIDFGFEIDFYGVVYFCSHCFSEVAATIGFISPATYESLKLDVEHAREDKLKLGAENVKFRVALRQLDFLGSHGAIVDFDPGVEESAEQKRSDNSKSAKQTDEPGRTNVSKTGKSKSTELDIDAIDI